MEQDSDYFKDIAGTIREPLLVLDKDLRVLSANRSFYRFFKVKAGETLGNLVYDLGNRQWDIPSLRTLLETILPEKAVFNDCEVEHEFPAIGRRILLLNARRIPRPPKEAQWILLAFEDVTRRAQLERLLQASEQRFRRAFETARDAMLLVDKTSGGVLNSNQAAQDLLGYSGRDLLQENLWELGILKDQVDFEQTSIQLEEQGVVGLSDVTIPTRQGGSFPVDIYFMDRAAVIQCNIREITARKQAEENLHESEKKWHDLFEILPVGISIVDSKHQVMETNSALAQILDLSKEDLLKGKFTGRKYLRPDRTLMPAEEFPSIRAVNEQKTIRDVEIGVEKEDGTIIWTSVSATPLFSGSGSATVTADITERKRAEVALRESEEKFRLAFSTNPDSMAITRLTDGRIVFVNKSFEQITGYTQKETIGKTSLEINIWKDPEDRRKFVEGLRAKGEVQNYAAPFLTRNGEIYGLMSGAIMDLNGVPHILNITRDITERKRAEEALRESEHRVSEALEFNRKILNTSSIGILTYKESGQCVSANAAAARITGGTVAQLLAQNFHEIPSWKKSGMYQAAIRALDTGIEQLVDVQIVTTFGKDVWLSFSFTRFDSAGERHLLVFASDITEGKQAEQALVDSENKFRWLYEYAPVAYHILTPEGVITDVNHRWCELLGFRREEALGKAIFDFVVEQEREAAKDSFERKKQSRQSYVEGSERKFRTRDGAVRTFKTYDFFSLDENQNITSVQTTIEDITERKQMEEVLRESENRYQLVFENSGTANTIFDADCRVILQNSMSRDLAQPGDGLGKTALEIFGPEQGLIVTGRMKRVLNSGVAEVFETDFSMPAGRKWIRSSYLPIRNEQNSILGIQVISQDISAQKQAQAAFEQAEAKYRNLFENAIEGIFQTTPSGRFFTANPALATILGYGSPEELIAGVSDLENTLYVQPGRREVYRKRLERDGMIAGFESEVYRKDGGVIWISENARIVRDDHGQAVSYEGTLTDITERKQAQARIQRQLEHLTTLSGIDRLISENFDLKLSLSEIVVQARNDLGADAADILIFNPNLQMLEYGAGDGFRTRVARNPQVRLRESLAGRAVLERKLVHIPKLSDAPDASFHTALLTGEAFVCYFGVPLIAKGQIKGVLEVYLRRALEPDEEWLDFLNTMAGQTALAIENATLFENLQRSNSELFLAYDATIEGWSHALDLRDKETEGHTKRVTELTLGLARRSGLSDADLVQVRWGALLHDIGKMALPDGILFKTGPLTDKEWLAMKNHPTFAFEMLSPIRYLHAAVDIPYCHHERWDGTGYPRGLKGEQIPLMARIFAVVDVWDALISDRPYRKAWSEENALQYIRAGAGTHFDPQVVKTFLLENR